MSWDGQRENQTTRYGSFLHRKAQKNYKNVHLHPEIRSKKDKVSCGQPDICHFLVILTWRNEQKWLSLLFMTQTSISTIADINEDLFFM